MSQAPRLNPAQREAVEHESGPVLVLAGAGSGKTRVITHRIVRLVERGAPAASIVALTFTNKAAAEMRERIGKMLGPSGRATARGLTVSTFHSLGLGVLQREREAVGGTFTIFDQGDVTSLVKQLLREAGADRAYDAQAVLARISNAKNALTAPGRRHEAAPGESVGEDDEDQAADPYDQIARELFPRYQAALRRFKAFDFDDLICEVALLWRDNAVVRERWQSRFLHVLVDEYQDTNRAQLELLRLLAGDRRNVCAVGDDDQAIYGWRGAEVRNILDFESHFAGARVIKLEQNYRSRGPILAVANAVIGKRVDARWRKVLFTERPGGALPTIAVAPTPDVEAIWVGREIRRALDEGSRPRDVAVLYRSNGQSKLIEEALREQGVSHRVVGGAQFFERKEIKDTLAYLKLALNPHDEVSLRRIINVPARGIGEASLERLALHAAQRQVSLWHSVERSEAIDGLSGPARDGCRELGDVVRQAARELIDLGRLPSEVARTLLERVRMRDDVAAAGGTLDASARRWANVEGLIETLKRREARDGKGVAGLANFLNTLTMDFDTPAEDAGDVVTLSTLHGSKGLEFELVFLIGCEEGYLPHQRTLDTRATDVTSGADDIEEERRLFYVGVTRARERLVMSRARTRVVRGKAVPRTPSRFLLDVPAELVVETEIHEGAPTTQAETAASVEAILAMLGPR